MESAPWYWGRRDKEKAARLADLVEQLASPGSAGSARRDVELQCVARAEGSFKATVSVHDTGRKDFRALLDARLRIRQGRQAQLKSDMDRQVSLVEIERLLGEKL